MICDVLLALSAVWCLASILLITIGCDQQAAMGLNNGKCTGLVSHIKELGSTVLTRLQVKRWTVVGVLDIVLEILLFFIAVIVVWPLKMTVSRRLSALSCFMCRLP